MIEVDDDALIVLTTLPNSSVSLIDIDDDAWTFSLFFTDSAGILIEVDVDVNAWDFSISSAECVVSLIEFVSFCWLSYQI